jgi:uncharacterized YccA/Bax inhibitor family protein
MMVHGDVFIVILKNLHGIKKLRCMRQMIKEHGDPEYQGWFVLFFTFWITVTIIWNYIT